MTSALNAKMGLCPKKVLKSYLCPFKVCMRMAGHCGDRQKSPAVTFHAGAFPVASACQSVGVVFCLL